MSTHINNVTALFTSHAAAQQAIAALRAAGFAEGTIGVIGPDRDGLHTAQHQAEHVGESYAGEGAVAGVAAGAGIGALWGLGILAGAIPAIGPAIAGGTLAVILSSAAAGAAAAGLGGSLIGLGIPKEEAEYFESEVVAGNTLVTVSAGDRNDEALAILRQHGGQDRASRIAATMQATDHGEPVIAPPAQQSEAATHRHLDFTSKLPISPADAQEELTGFASHAGTAPASAKPLAPEHVSFELPVPDPSGQREPLDEEANMPPVEVDASSRRDRAGS